MKNHFRKEGQETLSHFSTAVLSDALHCVTTTQRSLDAQPSDLGQLPRPLSPKTVSRSTFLSSKQLACTSPMGHGGVGLKPAPLQLLPSQGRSLKSHNRQRTLHIHRLVCISPFCQSAQGHSRWGTIAAH